MARRRGFVRRASSSFRAFRRRGRSSSSGGGLGIVGSALTGAAYGAVRNPVGNMIQGAVPRFAGGYEDEVILGGLGALLAWKGSGIMKSVGKTMLTVESYRAAASMTSNGTSGAMSLANANQGFI